MSPSDLLIPGLSGAVCSAATLTISTYFRGLKERREENKGLFAASTSLREYVERVWKSEREIHLQEKESLRSEISQLNERLELLERKRLEDEDVRRQMALRELDLLRQIGELQKEAIVDRARMSQLAEDNAALKLTVDDLTKKIQEYEAAPTP